MYMYFPLLERRLKIFMEEWLHNNSLHLKYQYIITKRITFMIIRYHWFTFRKKI